MSRIISLGLGVQSTALYYMSSMGELPRLDMAIFADTGAEKSATLEYLDYLLDWQKKNDGIPIYIARYKSLLEDMPNYNPTIIPAFYLDKNNEKHMVRRRCTAEYKIRQITKKYREIIKLPTEKAPFPKTEIWIGISYEEKGRMSKPNFREKYKTHIYPFCGYKIYANGKMENTDKKMIRTRSSIKDWYVKHNLPIPVKSSCVFCPFMSDFSWSELKRTDKKGFKIACGVDDQIRNYGNSFLHQSCTPLKGIKFKKSVKGFFDDLGNCSDYCNI